MNALVIVGLLLILVLVFYIASTLARLSDLITDAVPLNLGTGSNPQMKTIEAGNLDGPGSTRYNYSGWFFIDSNFTKKDTDNVLFNRSQDFCVCLNGSTLKIYAGVPTPTLATSTDGRIGTIQPGSTAPAIQIPNFPFQKWTHLVINVDVKIIDVYIDGKYVKSKTVSSAIGSTKTNDITYGNQYTQGSLARFSRPPTVISPQEVWNMYMQGSGQGQTYSSTSVEVEITKKGQIKSKTKLV